MDIDQENTVRALADKPLLARRPWVCAMGLHTWTQWSTPRNNTDKYGRRIVEQYRGCGYCNKTQWRTVTKF